MVIVAVIVTYHPDIEKLADLLAALAPQVNTSVIVDNGSGADIHARLQSMCAGAAELVALDDNRGIAAAQNIGISRAKAMGAEYVLLFDQDSVPDSAMVAALQAAIEKMRRLGTQVACAGPRYVDARQQNPPPFVRVRGLRLERCPCPDAETVAPVDYLISSGCLIPMTVLDQVGGMREDLFIDYVDIEWGLRAKRFGYQSFGVCAALMAHSLGDQPIRFLGRQLPLHSPLRHYYHFRNAVLLYREGWLPLNWKFVDAWRLLMKYGFYTLFAKPRAQQFYMMSLGILHGLRARAGKLETE
jgi:rhamnosyltransferase